MSIYAFAWIGVALTFVYFTAVAIAIHWKSARAVGVTRYEPPENVSPALAGYLIEEGRCRRRKIVGPKKRDRSRRKHDPTLNP
jgi:hypothetical protein